jgi:hypothetical protein
VRGEDSSTPKGWKNRIAIGQYPAVATGYVTQTSVILLKSGLGPMIAGCPYDALVRYYLASVTALLSRNCSVPGGPIAIGEHHHDPNVAFVI